MSGRGFDSFDAAWPENRTGRLDRRKCSRHNNPAPAGLRLPLILGLAGAYCGSRLAGEEVVHRTYWRIGGISDAYLPSVPTSSRASALLQWIAIQPEIRG